MKTQSSEYVERRPWMLDEHLYPVAKDYSPETGLELVYSRRDQLRNHVSSKFVGLIRYKNFDKWCCFISGVQCHAVVHRIESSVYKSKYNAPWAVTVDHLVPRLMEQNYPENKYNRINNTALVGYALNSNLGHIPFALKLHHKSILKTKEYDRDVMTLDNFFVIKQHIIDTEVGMKLGGLYPWQPWTYTDVVHKAAAEDFVRQMTKIDEEYLSLSIKDSHQFIEEFKWRW